MVSVCIEVASETGNLKVDVWARSIERAVRIVAERYLGSRVEVEFPIDPEPFFAEGSSTEGMISVYKNARMRAA